jgi:hypothetical protein
MGGVPPILYVRVFRQCAWRLNTRPTRRQLFGDPRRQIGAADSLFLKKDYIVIGWRKMGDLISSRERTFGGGDSARERVRVIAAPW